MGLEQLFPRNGVVDAKHAYGDLGLAGRAYADRPYVITNMVTSADGRATLGGKSSGISSEPDRELFHALRTQVDAVMAGTATIAIENYGPLVRDAERRKRRAALGLTETPLAVTASRSLELPVQAPLFGDPESRIVVLTSSDRELPECAAQVVIERLPGPDLDLPLAMRRLHEKHGVRSLLLEGGPTMLAAMVGAGVVDELFLTVAPLVVGSGPEPSILEETQLDAPVELQLKSVLRDENFLFLRYGLGPAEKNSGP